MKKVVKILLFLLALSLIKVKADVNMFMVETNYTTMYKNDELYLYMGFDTIWDEYIVEDRFDESIDDYVCITDENGYCEVRNLQLIFDKNVFELDTSNYKINDSFILEDIEKYEYNNYYIYEFKLKLKEIRDGYENDYLYDSHINDIILYNLKLKVKGNTTLGTYYLYTSYYDDSGYNDDEKYTFNKDNVLVNKYPITIIDNKNNSNSIKNVVFKMDKADYLNNYKYEFVPKSNEYKLIYLYELNYINIVCNTRCKVSGLGGYGVNDNWKEKLTYSIYFFDTDNSVIKFNLINKLFNTTTNFDWINNYGTYIIVVSNNNISEEYIKFLKDEWKKKYPYLKQYYYEYDDLNDIDKEVFANINPKFDKDVKSFIYIIDEGKIIYEDDGNKSIDELNKTENNNKSIIIYITISLFSTSLFIILLALLKKGKIKSGKRKEKR